MRANRPHLQLDLAPTVHDAHKLKTKSGTAGEVAQTRKLSPTCFWQHEIQAVHALHHWSHAPTVRLVSNTAETKYQNVLFLLVAIDHSHTQLEERLARATSPGQFRREVRVTNQHCVMSIGDVRYKRSVIPSLWPRNKASTAEAMH